MAQLKNSRKAKKAKQRKTLVAKKHEEILKDTKPKLFKWRLDKFDIESPCKSTVKVEDFIDHIIPKLQTQETRYWSAIANDKKSNHTVSLEDSSNKKSFKRWEALKLDEGGTCFSLRLDGTKRLYGFIHSHIYYIVWYDPNHEVWPSQLKNT